MYKSIFTDELSLDFEKTIPYLKEWGLTHCDLRGQIFQLPFESLSDEQLFEVKELLSKNGLELGCLQSSLAKVHLPDKERLDQEMHKLDRIIRASEILNCKMVRTFFFWQPPNGQEKIGVGDFAVRPDVQAQVMELFLPFAEKAKEAGIIFAFENCGCTKEECFKMIDLLDVPGWGFAWDPKNSWMHDKEERNKDIDSYLQKMAKRTNCVHVKSIGTISDDNGNAEYIPYDKIFEALMEESFDGPVSIETHNYDTSITNTEACKQVLDVIKKAWPSAAPAAQQEKSSITYETIKREWANDPVRFGVVGLGMGNVRSAEMMKTSGIKLIQVCDVRMDRCKRTSEALKVPYIQDINEMLANPEIEAVMVMNESGYHSKLVIPALEAGKHVLVTKPMEMALDKCDNMIKTAKKHDRLFAVDFCRRLRPSVQSLKAAVANNFLGRPLSASVQLRVRRDMNYFNADGGWRGTRELDGGVLSNQTVHHLDEIIYTFGMPNEVRCNAWTQNHDIEMEDLGIATWKYDSGFVVNIYATTCFPQESWYYQLECHGTEGAYIHREGGIESNPINKYFRNGEWTDQFPYPAECQWINSMDNFAEVIRKGGNLLATPQEGRDAVKMILSMYESAYDRNGEWVRL